MSEFELKTPQYDGRFPFVNQTKHCWQNYVDYQRCKNKKGEDFPACKEFFKVSRSLCPDDWIAHWDEQIDSGSFPVKLD